MAFIQQVASLFLQEKSTGSAAFNSGCNDMGGAGGVKTAGVTGVTGSGEVPDMGDKEDATVMFSFPHSSAPSSLLLIPLFQTPTRVPSSISNIPKH